MNELGITPNQIYLLYSILNSTTKPKFINIALESKLLRNLEFLSDDDKVTPKGLEILSDFLKVNSTEKQEQITTDDYVDKYLNLFPRGKLPSGKQARGDKKNIKNNFNWFFKNYNYTWDTVLKATALYVDEYEMKGFMFMRTSQYFISKANPDKTRDSELANYCSVIINGDYKQDQKFFSDKVV